MIEIKTPTPYLIGRVAENMSFADREEVWASHRHTPLESLHSSLSHSFTSGIALHDGRPDAVFGLAQGNNVGIPWMLATDGIHDWGRKFLRLSREMIETFHAYYHTLYNEVDIRHLRAQRWLAWLGFKAGEPRPVGMSGELFIPFVKEA